MQNKPPKPLSVNKNFLCDDTYSTFFDCSGGNPESVYVVVREYQAEQDTPMYCSCLKDAELLFFKGICLYNFYAARELSLDLALEDNVLIAGNSTTEYKRYIKKIPYEDLPKDCILFVA